MKTKLGILLDIDGDFLIKVNRNADGMIIDGLSVGDTTLQNQKILILLNPGELKEYPEKGVGINNFIDDDSPEEMLRITKMTLCNEGMKVDKIGYNEITGKLFVKAFYE